MAASSPPPTVKCPTCARPVEFSAASPWRPFCSERCRLIDLGAWLTERHAIPGEKVEDADDALDPRGRPERRDDP
jgi:endogenous inhibitor of DNA gyrase (YacG/DUF329 family)